jgi:hypothetical protein
VVSSDLAAAPDPIAGLANGPARPRPARRRYLGTGRRLAELPVVAEPGVDLIHHQMVPHRIEFATKQPLAIVADGGRAEIRNPLRHIELARGEFHVVGEESRHESGRTVERLAADLGDVITDDRVRARIRQRLPQPTGHRAEAALEIQAPVSDGPHSAAIGMMTKKHRSCLTARRDDNVRLHSRQRSRDQT